MGWCSDLVVAVVFDGAHNDEGVQALVRAFEADGPRGEFPGARFFLLHSLSHLLLTAISCALAFVVFALVLGLIHAEESGDGLNAFIHPIWVLGGGVLIALLCARLALGLAARLEKGGAGQVFVLVAAALLEVVVVVVWLLDHRHGRHSCCPSRRPACVVLLLLLLLFLLR